MEDEKLIEAAKKRIIIYDVSSLGYRNAEKKEVNWKEIALEIGCEGMCYGLMMLTNCWNSDCLMRKYCWKRCVSMRSSCINR